MTYMATMYPRSVKAPLIADLQLKFNLQCTMDGQKGVILKPSCARQKQDLDFGVETGFVPFRKTKVSNDLPWQVQGPSSQPTSSLSGKRSVCRSCISHKIRLPYNWKSWDGTGNGKQDARDALYHYSCKARERDMDINPVTIRHRKDRPDTASEIAYLGGVHKPDYGYRRTYTAFERGRTEQSRQKRENLSRTGTKPLHTDKRHGFFAVRRINADDSDDTKTSIFDIKDGQSDNLKNVKVKQETLARVDRPMKKENGHYRPISRTIVKTPKPPSRILSAKSKSPRSAETYQMILKQQKQRLQQQRQGKYSTATPVSLFYLTEKHMTSHYDHTENRLLQSVIDVNKPPADIVSENKATVYPETTDGENKPTKITVYIKSASVTD